MKVLREPLLQFLLLGALVYLAYGYFVPAGQYDESRVLTVNKAKIEWMKSAWQQRWNRPPTKAELDSLVRNYIRETVLYKEAVKMGLDKEDGVIRSRLAQKMEFLAKGLMPPVQATEEELKEFFLTHEENYRGEALYSFQQIYFNPDKRAMDEIEGLKATLNAQGSLPHKDLDLGDSFMLQSDFDNRTQSDIQKDFGPGFAESVTRLPSGTWHGPIASGYGIHLVYIRGVSEAEKPRFDQVKEEVLRDWTVAKEEAFDQQFYTALLDYYTVVVEDENVSDLTEAER